jgi:serine/threonine protein kinase
VTEQEENIDLVIGTLIQDRYRVISRVGEGGVGVVYMVEHTLVGRRYALKVLRPVLARSPEVIARFHREARAAAAIGDEHIVEIVDMGKLENGSPYLVMELLEGRPLSVELENQTPMPIERAVDIATQCCHALNAAHKKGIVHRDIKPENLFLADRHNGSDFIKILDFGISKVQEAANELNGSALTRTGTAMGTPQYMSVEQVNGFSDIDARTDVYAMGVVLFRMLTGRAPFEAPTYAALVTKVVHDPVPSLVELRPELPLELERVVHRALAKNREERFTSMVELAEALAPFREVGGDPTPTVVELPPARNDTPTVSARRLLGVTSNLWNKRAVVVNGLAVAAILGALLFAFAHARNRNRVTTSTNAVSLSAPTRVLRPANPAPEKPATKTNPLDNELNYATKDSHQTAAVSKRVEDKGRSKQPSRKATEHKTAKNQQTQPGKPLVKAVSRALPAPTIAKRGPLVTPTRTVTVRNALRTRVTVTFKCGSAATSASVSPMSQTSAAVPQESCQVSCTGVGRPVCPPLLSAANGSFDIL